MVIISRIFDDLQLLRTLLTYGASLLVAYATILSSWRSWRSFCHPSLPHKRNLPTPPGIPILGHVLNVPTQAPWHRFAEWRKLYGEIFLVWILGKPMVVLNTVEAAHELLDKKGANFSGRPPLLYIKEWVGWGEVLPFMQHDDPNYRKQRRILKPHLTPEAITKIYPVLYAYAQNMLDDMSASPDHFNSHIQHYLSCVMVMTVYGYNLTLRMDAKLLAVDAVARTITDADIKTQMIVDFIPFLRYLPAWFPGMHVRRVAERGSKSREEMGREFLADVDSQMTTSQTDSLVSRAFDELREETAASTIKFRDSHVKSGAMDLGTALYAAGVDASASTVLAFVLAMALHPRVARKAQNEIDCVLGGVGVRLPTFEDREKLPYVECILKEVLRWNPPAPIGVAHSTRRADEYKGMSVPGDSLVLANIWAMCRDETYFSSPDDFFPERHQEKVGKLHQGSNGEFGVEYCDPKQMIFGFGRHTCPGEYLADAMLWCAMAYILATFDILPPIDPVTGDALKLEPKFSTGTVRRPEQFSCRFVLRDSKTSS